MRFEQQLVQADMISQEALTGTGTAATPQIRLSIENLSTKEVDELPFGAIQLDRKGVILQFNDYEASLSGITKDYAVGKHFFTEIAPCTNVKEFYGRFKAGVADKKLYEKFRYHFAFKQNPRDVTVTLFYSELTDSIWVFVRPV